MNLHLWPLMTPEIAIGCGRLEFFEKDLWFLCLALYLLLYIPPLVVLTKINKENTILVILGFIIFAFCGWTWVWVGAGPGRRHRVKRDLSLSSNTFLLSRQINKRKNWFPYDWKLYRMIHTQHKFRFQVQCSHYSEVSLISYES